MTIYRRQAVKVKRASRNSLPDMLRAACYWLAAHHTRARHTPQHARHAAPGHRLQAAPRRCNRRGLWPSIAAAGEPPYFPPPPALCCSWRGRSFAPTLRCWCRLAAPPLVAGRGGPSPSSLLPGDALAGHAAEEPPCVLSFESSSRFVSAVAVSNQPILLSVQLVADLFLARCPINLPICLLHGALLI
jgi:hypothetical protein